MALFNRSTNVSRKNEIAFPCHPRACGDPVLMSSVSEFIKIIIIAYSKILVSINERFIHFVILAEDPVGEVISR